MNNILAPSQSFESIRNVDPSYGEYWLARDLADILQYDKWQNFHAVIIKAMTACHNSDKSSSDHFTEISKMVEIGSGAQRQVQDYRLSRYACYLVIQNADPSKEIVAAGQTYFAVQTRKQELTEQQSENQKRLQLREEMKKHNKHLASAAKEAGVIKPLDYAIFQDHGYKGLYGDKGQKEVQAHKGLAEKQKLLDHIGSTELAANLFRATQTEEKLRRERTGGKQQANQTHYDVGRKVRQTIAELGGTMPENLPVAGDIKKLARNEHKRLKAEEKYNA